MNINEVSKSVNISGEEKTWDRARAININNSLGIIPTITMVDDRVTVGPTGEKHVGLEPIVIKCDDPSRMITAINRETGEVVGRFPIALLDAIFTGLYIEEKNNAKAKAVN